MKIAVTGGRGFVGAQLLRRLAGSGAEVTALTRRQDDCFLRGVRTLTGDLAAKDCPGINLLAGCNVLLHCAGELHDPTAMRAVHVGGTERMLAAARATADSRLGPLHWVQLSSVGAYGSVQGRATEERIVTEETPEAPVGEYEITKTESDALVRGAARQGWLTYSIVRPSNIFGVEMPNDSLRQLAHMVRRGWFCYAGRGDTVAPYVHVEDVVELLIRCTQDVRARNQVFNFSNDCTLAELVSGMANAMGVAVPRLWLPEGMLRVAAAVGTVLGLRRLTQSRIDALVARTRYPAEKAARLLGVLPRRPVSVAIRELIVTR